MLPVLLYGVEGWTLGVSMMNKIEAFEMWLYRRMLRISWVDRVSNERVLNIMNKDRELLTTVKRRKAAYFGHILRGDKYSLLQLIVEGKIEGRRGVGRRRMSWLGNLRQWFDVPEAAHLIRLAQDRGEFGRMVADLR